MGLECNLWPLMVEMAGSDLLSEIAKAIGLLGSRLTVAVLRYCHTSALGLHAKVAATDSKISLLNLE